MKHLRLFKESSDPIDTTEDYIIEFIDNKECIIEDYKLFINQHIEKLLFD